MCANRFSWMWINRVTAVILGMIAGAGSLSAEAPLSAIDWLSQSVADPALPVAMAVPRGQVAVQKPDVTITITPLDGPSLDGLGLLPVSRTGFPRDLWGVTPSEDLVRMLKAERADTLPAIQALLYRVLLAELAPPADSAGRGDFFLARVDKLLDLGALDPALTLLDLPDVQRPEPFRRRFDIALLLGQEDRACADMRSNPQIAPTFPARIFCLARGGDWNAAALSLRTGEALGFIDPAMAALLERFLDPDLSEGEPDLAVPDRPTPLILRMMEAVGQPIPTTELPVAFAQADLSANTGWKARIEAGERLARTGAIEPNRLLGLYTEQKPAASGGVWDRVKAVQTLDKAMTGRDTAAVAAALPPLWAMLSEVELEVPFAKIYGQRLARLNLPGEPGNLAFRIGLLSDASEAVARGRVAQDGEEPFLIGLAGGTVDGLAPPDQLGGAIKAAFVKDAALSPDFAELIAGDRVGEALLTAIDQITDGARGDLRDVTAGLRLLREIGLESVARQAALELLLLERRG
jgi:hypothetical protein